MLKTPIDLGAGDAEEGKPAGERQAGKVGRPRDLALEGLRGFAAVMVFYNHVMVASVQGWSPPPWFIWPVDASAAVMIFFVLSGYVIGLTYPSGAAEKRIGGYAWRRVVRLMPINLLAVFLSCALAVSADWETALTNLFFLGNYSDYAGAWVPVLDSNPNLWSLNYEVFYYILFGFIWVLRLSLKRVVFCSLLILGLGWYTRFAPVFLACYAAGFLFWLVGLGLAWHGTKRTEGPTNWPSLLLIGLVTWKLQGLRLLVSGFHMPSFAGPVVKLYALDFLPVAALLVAEVSRRTFPGLGWVKVLATLLPVAGFVAHRAVPGKISPLDFEWMLVAYLLALALWWWRPSLRCFERLAPLGAISFALYALSRPIQEFIFRQGQSLPAGGLSFAWCAVTVALLSFATAWYVERRIQPAIQRTLVKKR